MHGLQAIVYLASLGEEGYVPIKHISERIDISSTFLTKILQHLTEAALLTSRQGPGGGVALARTPDAISLYDIIVAIDGKDVFGHCLLGLTSCGNGLRCPVQTLLGFPYNRLAEAFKQIMLADLVRGVHLPT